MIQFTNNYNYKKLTFLNSLDAFLNAEFIDEYMYIPPKSPCNLYTVFEGTKHVFNFEMKFPSAFRTISLTSLQASMKIVNGTIHLIRQNMEQYLKHLVDILVDLLVNSSFEVSSISFTKVEIFLLD